ncbi:MAG: M48 family metalloprotease [Saprospiraceae bacterium]
MVYLSRKYYLIYFLFVFHVSCRQETVNSDYEIEFKEEYYFPFNDIVDNNDLGCNYYFNEDINDALNYITKLIADKNIKSLHTEKIFVNRILPIEVVKDNEMRSKLNNILDKLLENTDNIDSCKCFIVNDDAFVNAFMLLGDIYIGTGLLNETINEDEIAMILGHEIGHAINHLEQQQILFSALIDIYNENSGFNDIASIILNGLFSFSQKGGEVEADVAGLYLMTKAGYDPKKGIEIFKRVVVDHDPPTSYFSRVKDELRSTHPYSVDRFNCLEDKINKYGIFPDSFHLKKTRGIEGTVTAIDAFVYEAPSELSSRLFKINKNDELRVMYKYVHDEKSYTPENIWVFIELDNGNQGWINDNYVKY